MNNPRPDGYIEIAPKCGNCKYSYPGVIPESVCTVMVGGTIVYSSGVCPQHEARNLDEYGKEVNKTKS